MPVITLEVMTDASTEHVQSTQTETTINLVDPMQDSNAGLHFLTENAMPKSEEDSQGTPKARNDLLEYMMRNDGSVVCKLCGEILQSRTHWYRHKYKLHVIQPLNPAPLFQCEQCLVYFKSRKGYIGHIASRHSEILTDSSPVLTNTQAEATARDTSLQPLVSPAGEKDQPDPEMSIPKTSVPNYQSTVVKQAPAKTVEAKRDSRGSRDSSSSSSNRTEEEKRSREEKLVADIINRVRRECEAQGSGGGTRRGYTRRYTVMHT